MEMELKSAITRGKCQREQRSDTFLYLNIYKYTINSIEYKISRVCRMRIKNSLNPKVFIYIKFNLLVLPLCLFLFLYLIL